MNRSVTAYPLGLLIIVGIVFGGVQIQPAMGESLSEQLRSQGIDPEILEQLDQLGPIEPAMVDGEWLIWRQMNGGQETQKFWNFFPIIGPLGLVTTDDGESGFTMDLSGSPPMSAFRLNNDFFACDAVYIAFQSPEVSDQIFGLFFCTDGSGGSGVWNGCNNFLNSYGNDYCAGLPDCYGENCE
ncbi:MAG: hypothetical protein PVJ84_09715 [Desulfobacteraceae bacterium]|jgi:hypothetical protein